MKALRGLFRVIAKRLRQLSALGSEYARRPSSFYSGGEAARAGGVDLPLVYQRDDRRHRCRVSLVDVVTSLCHHSRALAACPSGDRVYQGDIVINWNG
jgi:hypothetical protein